MASTTMTEIIGQEKRENQYCERSPSSGLVQLTRDFSSCALTHALLRDRVVDSSSLKLQAAHGQRMQAVCNTGLTIQERPGLRRIQQPFVAGAWPWGCL